MSGGKRILAPWQADDGALAPDGVTSPGLHAYRSPVRPRFDYFFTAKISAKNACIWVHDR